MKVNNLIVAPEIQHEEEILVMDNPTSEHKLMLINDDFNTFGHVIECLMKYCSHTIEQAEQCATIVHHKGICDVKRGSYDKLEPICSALLESGLTTEIQ